MEFFSKDTITALATAPLSAGVAVIRLSGEKSKQVAENLSNIFQSIDQRKMYYTKLEYPRGNVLDHALMAYFEAPNSFTGEDVVEIHCHGGQAVIQGILNVVTSFDGVRLAEAGEFTRRAFMNGKLDLTEAEGLADLIAAETDEQKRQALNQMEGELGQKFESWRSQVIHMLAHVEAAIDFPDEELEVLEEAGLKNQLESLLGMLNDSLASNVGQRLRQGFSVAIVGKPNAGKSTLTNLLSGKDTAIVSEIAGTTRDVIEVHLDIEGFPVVLADTAGLRETEDLIEKEGVLRARRKVEQADLTILVTEASEWPEIDPMIVSLLKGESGIIVVSKIDKDQINNKVESYRKGLLVDPFNNIVELESSIYLSGDGYPVLALDLTDNENLKPLTEALAKIIRNRFSQSQGAARLTRERHRQAVKKAIVHLEQAKKLYLEPQARSVSELLAQDLRDAASQIGSVTGMTDTEDVLDLVFSTFCIGK